ncbi:ANTAR domain-containing protein [Streptomyces sp. NPDC059002]|uniref:ANTAR domain-containing protein n=1 Tax=Streptomyces sp. NPDC059002 TaxID=3346690 RepID=UPI003685BB46
MTTEQRLADVFVALAGGPAAGSPQDPTDLLGTLSILAHHSPPLLGVRAAAVVFVPGGREAPQVVSSDTRVYRMEYAAVGHREGPAHDCHHGDRRPAPVPLDSPQARGRWPHYAPRAVALGYTHVAALPLRGHTRNSGALVLLSSGHRSGFSPGVLALGQSMADFTAVTLERAQEADHSRTLAAQLEQALTSRVVIEQAKGMIAARRSLSLNDAFDLLRRHARSHRRLLSDVAREVVEGRADPELSGERVN